MEKIRYVAGVDEAGRGPLAGPVAVGVVVVSHNFDWTLLPWTNDSKKVSERRREETFRAARTLRREGVISYHVALVSVRDIDRLGITKAAEKGVAQCFKKLTPHPETTTVKLDGLLKAPPVFKFQKTIVRGDSKEKVIGLASILAKVTRDEYMRRLAKKYTRYGFEVHKGYGTKRHIENIRKFGLSRAHRKLFTKNIIRKVDIDKTKNA